MVDETMDVGPSAPEYIRRRAALDPKTPSEVLAKLADDPDGRVRVNVASHPNTSVETLIKLTNDQRPKVRRRIACRCNVPPEILAKLADDPYECVRTVVARHPNTPPEALTKLATDRAQHVRYYVACNPNTPVEVLVRLINDPDEGVRYEAMRNPSIPLEVVIPLARVVIIRFPQGCSTKAVRMIIPGIGSLVVFTDDNLRARPVHPGLLQNIMLPALAGDPGMAVHDRGIIAVPAFAYAVEDTSTNEPISKDRLEQLALAVQFATPEIPQPLVIPAESAGIEFVEEPAHVLVTSGGEQFPEEGPKAKPLGTVRLVALVDPFDVFNGTTGLLSYRLKGTNLIRFVFSDPVPVTSEIKQKLERVPKIKFNDRPQSEIPHVETNGSYVYALWYPFEEWELGTA